MEINKCWYNEKWQIIVDKFKWRYFVKVFLRNGI